MPAVVSSSTLADAPDTPHHRAAPGDQHPRPHTKRVAPRRSAVTQTRPSRSTPRVAGRHDRATRRGPSNPAGAGDEHGPCPGTCPRRTGTACRSAGACRRHPRRCRAGKGYRRRWTCRGCSPCPHPRDQPKGNRSHTPAPGPDCDRGNGSGTHRAVPEGCRSPRPLSCASDASANAARRPSAARLSLARQGRLARPRLGKLRSGPDREAR